MTDGLPDLHQVPFVLAVTGHRDPRPEDMPALRQEIAQVFLGLRARMPHTPLLLLSGLAEGADQIVAEVALEQHVAVAAVLPMPLAVYRTTMPEAAAEGMDKLLSRAVFTIDLPTAGRTPEQLLASESDRAMCYETLALYLARYCQALIALWDGVHSDKKGGTANVVRYVRSGVRLGGPNEVESGCGVVYQVVTPRVSSKQEHLRPVRTFRLACRPARDVSRNEHEPAVEADNPPTSYAQVERDIDRFNREAAAAARSGKLATLSTPGEAVSPFGRRVETLYGLADAISLRANAQRRLFLLLIILTAVAGTIFYGVHGELMPREVMLWFTFPVFVTVALLLYQAARLLHVDERYLDGRALAEALRVQFYWELGGVDQSVDRFCLVNRQEDLDWIRLALKNVWLLHQGRDEPAPLPADETGVLVRWVKDQRAWYGHKADRQAQSVRQRERVSRNALLIAVGWSVLVPASLLLPGPWHALPPWSGMGAGAAEGGVDWYGVMHIVLAVPALLAGAYRLWIEQSGYEEQAREYRYMEHEFAARGKALESGAGAPDVARTLLLELGIEALKENGRWLLLHRERPLEVVSAP